MKILMILRKCVFIIGLLGVFNVSAKEPIKVSPSMKIYYDLSDSYGRGSLLSGALNFSKSWYGLNFDIGYFQGHSTFYYDIFIEDLGKTIKIQFDELSNLNVYSGSLLFIPIEKEWFTVGINCGMAVNCGTLSQFNGVDYSYNLVENKFNYLYKDYKLVRKTHFGYQVGLDISFYVLPKIGLQLSSRVQDLNNGGTFFFVGGGLCFRL